MVTEDVHAVEAQTAQALVQAGEEVGAAAIAVGAVPHHVARLLAMMSSSR